MIRPRVRRPLGAIAVALACVAAAPATARAVPSRTATATTVDVAAPNTAHALPGFAISGGDDADTLLATVATDVGTLSLTSTPGVTLAYGYVSWADQPSIAVVGTRDAINASLATLTLSPGDTAGQTAHVSLNVYEQQAGLTYSPTNGHFYQYVDKGTDISWTAARAEAQTRTYGGQSGYLATIPTTAINDLITSKLEGALSVWFGGYEIDTPTIEAERTWIWADGPLAGQIFTQCTNYLDACDPVGGSFPANTHWSPGEPNNSGGEFYPVTNWGSPNGLWNDLPDSAGVEGYVVEYGDEAVGTNTPFDGTTDAVAAILIAAAPAPTPTPTATPSPTPTSTPDAPAPAPAAPAAPAAAPVAPAQAPAVPRRVRARAADRTLTVSFLPVAGAKRYEISLDGGKTYVRVATTGKRRLTAVVEGVANGVTYRVRVRAVGGAPSATASARAKAWFSAAAAKRTKSARSTRAAGRTRSGSAAATVPALEGRALQAGEAATLSTKAVFAFDSARLTARGRAEVRALARSLRYNHAIVCEGYADYGGSAAHELALSVSRAKAVCAALKAAGARVTTTTVGYGGTRPVVVGGSPADRAANRRVVVLVRR